MIFKSCYFPVTPVQNEQFYEMVSRTRGVAPPPPQARFSRGMTAPMSIAAFHLVFPQLSLFHLSAGLSPTEEAVVCCIQAPPLCKYRCFNFEKPKLYQKLVSKGPDWGFFSEGIQDETSADKANLRRMFTPKKNLLNCLTM